MKTPMTRQSVKADETTTPGPAPVPERVKTEGDWTSALKKALDKKRPPEGWPKDTRPKKGR
jgi:hypothetical protein